MITALCPLDLTSVPIYDDGIGQCSKCGAILLIPIMVLRFGCEHTPRPLRGNYQFRSHKVPYEYCSMSCKLEAEASYPPGIKDKGLI